MHGRCLSHFSHRHTRAASDVSAMTATKCYQPNTRWEAAVEPCCGWNFVTSESSFTQNKLIEILRWHRRKMKCTRLCCGESYTSFLWDFCSKTQIPGYTPWCVHNNSPRKLCLGHCRSGSPLDSRIILQRSPIKISRLLPFFHRHSTRPYFFHCHRQCIWHESKLCETVVVQTRHV